jgi:hypothetical protein
MGSAPKMPGRAGRPRRVSGSARVAHAGHGRAGRAPAPSNAAPANPARAGSHRPLAPAASPPPGNLTRTGDMRNLAPTDENRPESDPGNLRTTTRHAPGRRCRRGGDGPTGVPEAVGSATRKRKPRRRPLPGSRRRPPPWMADVSPPVSEAAALQWGIGPVPGRQPGSGPVRAHGSAPPADTRIQQTPQPQRTGPPQDDDHRGRGTADHIRASRERMTCGR